MTYFPDLTTYEYEPNASLYRDLPTDQPMLNVGWLGPGHEFDTGPVDQEVVDGLLVLAEYDQNLMRGFHYCAFCDEESPIYVSSPGPRGRATLGMGEIHLEGLNGTYYVAPTLIIHYITRHHYQPPKEFRDAIRGSAERRAQRIQAARHVGHVTLRGQVYSLTCADHGHTYAAPVHFLEWLILRNETQTQVAALNVYDPWVQQIYDAVKDATPWDPTRFETHEFGPAALDAMLDPAPDGSRYLRETLPLCPIDGSAPSSSQPVHPPRFAEVQVPLATHTGWDQASLAERHAQIQESVEHSVAISWRFKDIVRPGLAAIDAERHVKDVIEPTIGRELVVTSSRSIGDYYVFDYNTRAFVDTARSEDGLGVHGALLMDRRTGEITVADPTIPIDEHIDGPERTFYY